MSPTTHIRRTIRVGIMIIILTRQHARRRRILRPQRSRRNRRSSSRRLRRQRRYSPTHVHVQHRPAVVVCVLVRAAEHLDGRHGRPAVRCDRWIGLYERSRRVIRELVLEDDQPRRFWSLKTMCDQPPCLLRQTTKKKPPYRHTKRSETPQPWAKSSHPKPCSSLPSCSKKRLPIRTQDQLNAVANPDVLLIPHNLREPKNFLCDRPDAVI